MSALVVFVDTKASITSVIPDHNMDFYKDYSLTRNSMLHAMLSYIEKAVFHDIQEKDMCLKNIYKELGMTKELHEAYTAELFLDGIFLPRFCRKLHPILVYTSFPNCCPNISMFLLLRAGSNLWHMILLHGNLVRST